MWNSLYVNREYISYVIGTLSCTIIILFLFVAFVCQIKIIYWNSKLKRFRFQVKNYKRAHTYMKYIPVSFIQFQQIKTCHHLFLKSLYISKILRTISHQICIANHNFYKQRNIHIYIIKELYNISLDIYIVVIKRKIWLYIIY